MTTALESDGLTPARPSAPSPWRFLPLIYLCTFAATVFGCGIVWAGAAILLDPSEPFFQVIRIPLSAPLFLLPAWVALSLASSLIHPIRRPRALVVFAGAVLIFPAVELVIWLCLFNVPIGDWLTIPAIIAVGPSVGYVLGQLARRLSLRLGKPIPVHWPWIGAALGLAVWLMVGAMSVWVLNTAGTLDTAIWLAGGISLAGMLCAPALLQSVFVIAVCQREVLRRSGDELSIAPVPQSDTGKQATD